MGRALLVIVALSMLACESATPKATATANVRPASPWMPAVVPHGLPVRLSIPKLGLDAPVEQVGTDSSGAMGIPHDYRDVAWFAPGVVPGDDGDAVIDGHLDWVVNGKDVRAVFWSLGSLQAGDELDVATQDGRVLKFSVTQLQLIPNRANPSQYGLFDTSGPPRLTLITCAGDWSASLHTYLQRLAVTGTAKEV
jgi:LPXTG-site transpeptidase (sortase) family protein